MSKKIGPLVFDAFPFLVLYRKQNGWDRVMESLEEATEGSFSHISSLINIGEVYYTLLRDHGIDVAQDGLARIQTFPVQIVYPSFDQMLQAARFKAGGGLSYADCYAAALALERGIPVLTGDPEFSAVERQGVTIEWLPRNR